MPKNHTNNQLRLLISILKSSVIFDRSLVEAVQGIALSGDFRLPFAQI